MGELLLQAGIPGGENAPIAGPQAIVDADASGGVVVDARNIQIEALDVGYATGACQDGIDSHRALVISADQVDKFLAAFRPHLDGFRVESDFDAIARKDIRKKLCSVAFFLGQKQRQALGDGSVCAKAAKRLRQLAA